MSSVFPLSAAWCRAENLGNGRSVRRGSGTVPVGCPLQPAPTAAPRAPTLLLPASLCMPLHFVGTKRRSCHRDQTQPIHIILLYYRYLAFSSGSPRTGGKRPGTAREAAGTREPLPADPLPPAWPQRRNRRQQQGGPRLPDGHSAPALCWELGKAPRPTAPRSAPTRQALTYLLLAAASSARLHLPPHCSRQHPHPILLVTSAPTKHGIC